jgi:hypothetical protein
MFTFVNRIRVVEDEVKFEDVLKVRTQMKANEAMLESRRKTNKKDKKGEKSAASTVKSDIHELAAGDSKGSPRGHGLFYELNGTAVWQEKPLKLHSAKMLHMIDETLDEEGFTVIDYPDEYPEAVELTNFIAQQGFCKSLKNEQVFKKFKDIYNEHVLEKFRATKQSKGRNLVCFQEVVDDSSVVPLPLVLQQYDINVGEIPLNGSCEKVVRFFVHGSQMKAAIRTETFVPGFSVKFLQSSEIGNFAKILDYDVDSSNLCEVYQNRRQRESRELPESQQIVKRCHSFDFTSARVHSRRVPSTARERHEINQIYNEMMSPKKKVDKNPLVQSEIFMKSALIDGPKIFDFKIKLTPSEEAYELNADFDEIIFLDVSF